MVKLEGIAAGSFGLTRLHHVEERGFLRRAAGTYRPRPGQFTPLRP